MIVYNGFNNQTGVCGLYIPDILTTGKYIETASISYFFPFFFLLQRLCVFLRYLFLQLISHGSSLSHVYSLSVLVFDQLTLVLLVREDNDSVSDKLYKRLLSTKVVNFRSFQERDAVTSLNISFAPSYFRWKKSSIFFLLLEKCVAELSSYGISSANFPLFKIPKDCSYTILLAAFFHFE